MYLDKQDDTNRLAAPWTTCIEYQQATGKWRGSSDRYWEPHSHDWEGGAIGGGVDLLPLVYARSRRSLEKKLKKQQEKFDQLIIWQYELEDQKRRTRVKYAWTRQ